MSYEKKKQIVVIWDSGREYSPAEEKKCIQSIIYLHEISIFWDEK